ncbi:aquaporin-7 isoform X2 [Gallus gallus]|uniref:Aquaporin 7 n=1 Tax=Gallus gallus TaxID=9031 RepID=A0A8V0Y543_CHICK|nr:aquaporin-7 isoform X2 [Gallus gallus]XP_046791357.1 aquaporin-7 isoform X2 [Gallus gallus]
MKENGFMLADGGLMCDGKLRTSSQSQRRVKFRLVSKSRLEPESKMLEKIQKMLTIRSNSIRELLAEALGMYILMVLGLSSVAQTVLGKGEFGQYLSINLGFGIGVTMGIHAAGGISGAHLNAAITLTHCMFGNLPWRKLPVYLLGQFLGSFLAAATIFGLYYDALHDYTNGNFTVTGPTATASIFSTYPSPYMSLTGGFFTEFIATVMLLLGILVIHDEKNNGALKGTHALVTGILVLGIGMGMGMNTGYAINPSRDLPPRIFTAIAGWGVDVFRAGNYWWWVPVVAPTLGSLAGGLIHKLLIDIHNQPVLERGNEKGQQEMVH